jgi:comEA protein
MKFINRLADKYGFTSEEIKVILFFIVLIAAGTVYKLSTGQNFSHNTHAYTKQDSLFFQILGDTQAVAPRYDSLFKAADSVSGMAGIKKESPHKGSIPDKSININRASVKELSLLPGVGEKTAEKIIAYRNQIGSFNSLEQIMDVKGIGEKKFEKLKRFIVLR